MGKSMPMWMISLIVVIIVAALTAIVIYYHQPIITYLTIPKLIIPIQVVKLLSYFSRDQILLDLLSMRSYLSEQLDNLYTLPVFILYGDLENQKHLHSYHLKSLVVYYSSRGLIIKIYDKKQITIAVNLIYDLWYKSNPIGIIIRDTLCLQQEHLAYYLADYIYQNMRIKPVIVMILGDNCANLGFQKDTRKYFSEQLLDLQTQWENILLKEADNNMEELYLLIQSREKIKKYHHTIEESAGVFGGLYLYNNNMDIEFIFSLGNWAEINHVKSYRWIINTAGIAICSLIAYRGYELLQTHRQFQLMHKPVQEYMQEKKPITIDHSIKNLHFYSNLTHLLLPQYTTRINNFQQEMILAQSITPINQFEKNIFSDEPTDTTLFINIEYQIQQLMQYSKRLEYIQYNNRLSDYYQLIYNKIVQLFEIYWQNLQNYQLIYTSNSLEKSLNRLRTNCSVDVIKEVYLNIKQLENDCELDHKWWIGKKIPDRLLNLLDKIEQIKFIGPRLRAYCENQTEDKLRLLHNQILHNYHELCDVFLFKDHTRLKISNSLKKLQENIMLIYTHPLMQVISTQQNSAITKDNKVVFWKYQDLLRIKKKQDLFFQLISQIHEMKYSLRSIFAKFAQEQMAQNLRMQLIFSQTVVDNPNIVTVAENLKQNGATLKQIDEFAYKDLEYKLEFIEPNLRENSKYIAKNIVSTISDSILTAHNKLPSWNGENIVQFLFNVDPPELPEYIDKLLNQWQDLVPIILSSKEYLDHNSYLYDFLSYFQKQIQNYDSPHNHLNKFIKYILDLPNYKLQWQEQPLSKSSRRNLFIYNLQKYQSLLAAYGNKILLRKSISYYQIIYQNFQKIYNKFPFGSVGEARHDDIIAFIKSINKYSSFILSDQGFQQAYPKQYKTVLELQFLADHMKIRDNKIYIECNLHYHVDQYGTPMTHNNYEHNSRLIVNYITVLGDQSYNTDQIVQQSHNIYHPFELQIKYANHLQVQSQDSDTCKYDFNYNWGLVSFIKSHEYNRIGNDVIFKLKINLPDSEEYIITYGKMVNWPNFNIVLDVIDNKDD